MVLLILVLLCIFGFGFGFLAGWVCDRVGRWLSNRRYR
jgi:NhaP-type Na+/H+ or K+/H+ antiporter